MQNFFESINPPYIAVEFDYFRFPREKWELFLTRLWQMGLEAISITVPWGFHEFEQGIVDLNGATNPRRNLIELIGLCRELGFQCILNLGSHYRNKGILNEGAPIWFTNEEGKRETILRNALENWYKAVSHSLVSAQWPDGPVVLVNYQIANASETYDEQLTKVKWPIWLRKHHRGIEALNTAYGTNYRSVSEVVFPQSWSKAASPLEQDARQFLLEFEQDTRQIYSNILTQAGWRIPMRQDPMSVEVQDKSEVGSDDVLTITTYPLAELTLNRSLPLDIDQTILVLQQPIQSDPDPVDIGQNPVWANQAPIRPDGSLRYTFWQTREQIWQQTLPMETNLTDEVLTRSLAGGGIISSGRDTILKISLPERTKPELYRLSLSGELQTATNLSVARRKLSGIYLTEESTRHTTQTDLIVYLNEPSSQLDGFFALYLQQLLNSQAQTLALCSSLAMTLYQSLNDDTHEHTKPSQPAVVTAPTTFMLAEARRGLREADTILRKAINSIGGLETGFETILERGESGEPQPAAGPVTIRSDVFEGAARELIIEVGDICADIAPKLNYAAVSLQNVINSSDSFTVSQYQESYSMAVATVDNCRQRLLALISKLRVEIAAKELPLVAWRIHDQVQRISEWLRWGVLRE